MLKIVLKVTESSRIKLFYNYFFGTNGFVALGDFNQIHTIWQTMSRDGCSGSFVEWLFG